MTNALALKSTNPFKPASTVPTHLKLLVYGDYGAGKSHYALTVACDLARAAGKRVAALSLEDGLEYLSDRFDFDILQPKTPQELEAALNFLASPEGAATYGAVVMDPATMIYDAFKDSRWVLALAKAGANGTAALSPADWNVVKAKMKAMATKLRRADIHVVVTAWEATKYQASGNQLSETGQKPDVDKTFLYGFDFVARLAKAGTVRTLTFDKERGGHVPASVTNPDAEVFAFARGARPGWRGVVDSQGMADGMAAEEESHVVAATQATIEATEAAVAAIEALDADEGAAVRKAWDAKRLVLTTEAQAIELRTRIERKLALVKAGPASTPDDAVTAPTLAALDTALGQLSKVSTVKFDNASSTWNRSSKSEGMAQEVLNHVRGLLEASQPKAALKLA